MGHYYDCPDCGHEKCVCLVPAVSRRPVLFLGEDNPLSADTDHALYPYPPGCSGDRLRQILGLTRRAYMSPMVQRRNACAGSWDLKEARQTVVHVLANIRYWSLVMLLGAKLRRVAAKELLRRRAATEFNFMDCVELDGSTVMSAPHPSGRSREWNDDRVRLLFLATLSDVAPHVPWGEHP